ncbi:MAG: RuvX/YqgF family protein [Armatimonadetes bacterium]|nr:RuvX/YqgF family protein [Candidatus Hippobium faecium]
MIVIGIDPGRKMCGICVEDSYQGTIKRRVISSRTLLDCVAKYKSTYPEAVIVCGDSAASRELINKINTLNFPIEFVNEENTTKEARKIYWQRHRKPLWGFFLPRTMLTPRRRIDDYAAVIIARRYMDSK